TCHRAQYIRNPSFEGPRQPQCTIADSSLEPRRSAEKAVGLSDVSAKTRPRVAVLFRIVFSTHRVHMAPFLHRHWNTRELRDQERHRSRIGNPGRTRSRPKY